jgi:hypothetical protein
MFKESMETTEIRGESEEVTNIIFRSTRRFRVGRISKGAKEN